MLTQFLLNWNIECTKVTESISMSSQPYEVLDLWVNLWPRIHMSEDRNEWFTKKSKCGQHDSPLIAGFFYQNCLNKQELLFSISSKQWIRTVPIHSWNFSPTGIESVSLPIASMILDGIPIILLNYRYKEQRSIACFLSWYQNLLS